MRHLLLHHHLHTLFRHHTNIITHQLSRFASMAYQHQIAIIYQKSSTDYDISPSTFLTVHLYPSYILIPTKRTRIAFIKPFSNTTRMILMPTYQLCIRILIQTYTTRCVEFLQWWSLRCMFRPFERINAIGYLFLLCPFHLIHYLRIIYYSRTQLIATHYSTSHHTTTYNHNQTKYTNQCTRYNQRHCRTILAATITTLDYSQQTGSVGIDLYSIKAASGDADIPMITITSWRSASYKCEIDGGCVIIEGASSSIDNRWLNGIWWWICFY
jgi:hypothetical protein